MKRTTTYVGNYELTEDMVKYLFPDYSYDQISAAITELWNDSATRNKIENFLGMFYSWYSRMTDKHIDVFIPTVPQQLRDFISKKPYNNSKYRFESIEEFNERVDDVIRRFDADFEKYNKIFKKSEISLLVDSNDFKDVSYSDWYANFIEKHRDKVIDNYLLEYYDRCVREYKELCAARGLGKIGIGKRKAACFEKLNKALRGILQQIRSWYVGAPYGSLHEMFLLLGIVIEGGNGITYDFSTDEKLEMSLDTASQRIAAAKRQLDELKKNADKAQKETIEMNNAASQNLDGHLRDQDYLSTMCLITDKCNSAMSQGTSLEKNGVVHRNK